MRANEVAAQTQLVAPGWIAWRCRMRHGEELDGVVAYSDDVRNSRPTPKSRAAIKGPVQWRMDYIGTVALLDDDKQVLASWKYRLPGNAQIATLVERVMADVQHVLTQRPVEVAVVQDGAPELWAATTAGLGRVPRVLGWTEVLDWYHLDERRGKERRGRGEEEGGGGGRGGGDMKRGGGGGEGGGEGGGRGEGEGWGGCGYRGRRGARR